MSEAVGDSESAHYAVGMRIPKFAAVLRADDISEALLAISIAPVTLNEVRLNWRQSWNSSWQLFLSGTAALLKVPQPLPGNWSLTQWHSGRTQF